MLREVPDPYKTPEPEMKFKGVWIPAEIWLNEDLNCQEKCLLAQIDALTDDEEPCFASNEWLSSFLGVSISTISHMLVDLKKKGWIETTPFDGRIRYLKLADPLPKSATPLAEFSKGPRRNRQGLPTYKNGYVLDDQEFAFGKNSPKAKYKAKIKASKKKIEKKESPDDPFFESLISQEFKEHPKYAEFLSDWKDYVAHRGEIKKPLTVLSAKRALNALQAFGIDGARSSIDQAIQSCWTGIWAPKNGHEINGVQVKKSIFSEPDYSDPNA